MIFETDKQIMKNWPISIILLPLVTSIFGVGAILLVAGCSSPQTVSTTPQVQIPTSTALPEATITPEDIPSSAAPSNVTITITGTVKNVVTNDQLIIIETAAGNHAIVAGADSILGDKDDTPITLLEINRGMLIQATGQPQEDDLLIAQHVLILEEPTLAFGTPTLQPSPAPPTPITLSDVSSEWESYSFPDPGVILSMPSDWEMIRMPGAYFFAPTSPTNKTNATQLTVSTQGNVPANIEGMREALEAEWKQLAPDDFYTTPVIVANIEGIAFWNLSEASCTNIYIPTNEIVYAISFFSTFCNESGDRLNEVGQRILESIEFHPPEN